MTLASPINIHTLQYIRFKRFQNELGYCYFQFQGKDSLPENLDDKLLVPIDFCSILEKHFDKIIKTENH